MCLKQKNIFHRQLPSRIPTLIDVDSNRLRQVLLNLLSNSAKFTHEGNVTLSVSLESGERGRSLHFAVSDTGIGIDLTSNIDIFGAFQQIQATRGSTGLGLFIAQRILTAMGSTLHVSSTVGQGSTFSFALPILKLGDGESNWFDVPTSKTGYGKLPQDMDWLKHALPEDAALDELASLASHGRLTDIENWVEFHCKDPSYAAFTAVVREMLENFDFSGIHSLALHGQERTQRQPLKN